MLLFIKLVVEYFSRSFSILFAYLLDFFTLIGVLGVFYTLFGVFKFISNRFIIPSISFSLFLDSNNSIKF